ncbi:hypothetical protein [uncultured Bartonella sp.]|uniref:hypothetical protein n=1 Tax=uncultured Bartonella sp. TaxID=104108 RepID=UPI0026220F8F|nr:hypothetical protein [uncultured Bartonella sp.]
MKLTPVQNLKFASVRILQETIDIAEKKNAKPATLTQQIFKAKEEGSNLKVEEKSTYDKIRDKIARATLFDSSRMSKEELKAKVLRELAEAMGVDIDKGGENFRDLGRKIRNALEQMKLEDPARYKEFIDGLNKKLGLDKLGLSVEDFIAAIADPGSDKAKELDKKLDAILNDSDDGGSKVLDEVQEQLEKLEEASNEAAEALEQQESVITDQETSTYMPKNFPPSRKSRI